VKAKERIERVRKGEDAGLKAPFDPSSPAHRGAVANMGRVAGGQYLIDDDRLREIASLEDVAADVEAKQAIEARLAAAREKRSRAAQKGWSRYDDFFEEQRYWRAQRGDRGR